MLALYEDFCRSLKLDPTDLIQLAYDDMAYTKQEFRQFRRAADWEGTSYPLEWNPAAISALLESLHEINYHSLAAVVEETVDGKS